MKIRIWSHFARFINIGPSEGPHVFIAWCIGLLGRVSFGIGWTVMIVYFVSNYGINSLPYLFVIHALGMIFGSFLFSGVVNRLKKEHLLIVVTLFTAFVLAAASVSFGYNDYLFLGLVFVALSILHSQLKIVHSLFVEELFTPTQSIRVFPIIESSETVGIILGGLFISSLAHVMPLNKFLYIWMITILMTIPVIIFYMQHSIAIPFVDLVRGKKKSSRMGSIKSVFEVGKKMKFVQSIIIIVFLQWAFFNVLEFQFTKAVEQSVNHTQEQTLVLNELNEFGKASMVIARSEVDKGEPNVSVEDNHEVLDDEFQENFASDLGNLQMLFGLVTLVFQLFLASRILSYLGVVGSMLVSPLVLLVSIIFMTFRFGFGSAIVARFNHEIAHVLHMNAYHSSYYVLSHEMRANVKEFLEGFVRPVGAIAGTLLIFLVTFLFSGETATFVLNLIAFVIVLLGLFSVIQLKDRYREVPRQKLLESSSLNELINAVLIIRQNGEVEDLQYLIQVNIDRDDLPVEVQKEIIESLGQLGDASHLNYLINLISDRGDLKIDILMAINGIFSRNYDEISSKPFTMYALRNLYEALLKDTSDPRLKGEVISFVIMSNYHEGFVDQIVELLNNDLDTETVVACSSVLKDLDDQHVVAFVENFLGHEDPKVRATIIEVMWSHLIDKTEANHVIEEMLLSKSAADVTEGLILMLNLNESHAFVDLLNKVLPVHSSDSVIMFLTYANRSLVGPSQEFYDYVYTKLSYTDLLVLSGYVDRIMSESVCRVFRRKVISVIHDHYVDYEKYIDDSESLSGLQAALLSRLRELYRIIGADKEYFIVEEILRSS